MPSALAAQTTTRTSNLPVPRTPLIGRERELAAVRELLARSDVPVVTLTGPGGVGKTRLALQVAWEVAGDPSASSEPALSNAKGQAFADGLVFVPLAALADPALVVPTVAQAVGVRPVEGQPADEALRAYLRDRELLLVLDNIEQVAEAASPIAGLLEAAPGLTVLATSRGPLRVHGEHELAIPPLSLPPAPRRSRPLTAADLADSEAVQLFLQRARAVDPSLTLTDANAATIAEICLQLDGLPLALELAAARGKLLSPQAMLARLTNRLSLLTGGGRDVPPRQQTMRNAIAWSYDLLTPEEQALFRRLSVFAGGFTLEAAEAVCGQSTVDRRQTTADRAPVDRRLSTVDSVIDGLAALADHSLLRRVEGADGEQRIVMMGTIREFAAAELAGSGEEAEVRAAHAAYYLALAEQGTDRSRREDQREWFDLLVGDLDNLRAVLGWYYEQGDAERMLRVLVALAPLWSARGYVAEGRQWVERGLRMPGATTAPDLIEAVRAGSWLAGYQGDSQRATDLAEEALGLARKLGHPAAIVKSLSTLGGAAFRLGDLARAREHWEGALAQADRGDDDDLVAAVLINLAVLAVEQRDDDRAEALVRRAKSTRRYARDPLLACVSAIHLAEISRRRGDMAGAIAYVRQALAIAFDLKHNVGIVGSLSTIADLARQHDPVRAARLLAAGDAVREEAGFTLGALGDRELDEIWGALRSRLSQADLDSARVDGRALPLESAIHEALDLLDDLEQDVSVAPAIANLPAEAASLTPREREILYLVADGRTNQDIADALSISLRTVQTHVANILAKLGLNSRAAVAAYAVRHGLV
jgi:predicted ATPase/DNA-binding CsgD family transcriptional regulator